MRKMKKRKNNLKFNTSKYKLKQLKANIKTSNIIKPNIKCKWRMNLMKIRRRVNKKTHLLPQMRKCNRELLLRVRVNHYG